MNAELIAYIVGIVVVVVAGGLLWLRKYKGMVLPVLDDAEKIVEVVERLLEVYYHDDQARDKSSFYIDVVLRVVDEVRELFDDSVDVKKKSNEIIYRLLKALNETPTAKHHQLISNTLTKVLAELEAEKQSR